ncbi:hypothetical protein [Arthrobacter sp. 2MCAF14]|uniref:hypothetical protein n=1 Tax=Arthrobacter sp. 2MCAF14 TaxID=3232982 RepID=UPI003F911C14
MENNVDGRQIGKRHRSTSDWLRTTHAAIATLVLGSVVLAGCGTEQVTHAEAPVSSSSPTPDPTRQASITPTPEPAPSGPARHTTTLRYTATWSLKNANGFTYDLSIDVASPVPIPTSGKLAHPLDANFEFGLKCTADPKRDVLIPGAAFVTATTDKFDTPINAQMILNRGAGPTITSGNKQLPYGGSGVAPADGDDRIAVERSYNDGVVCSTFSSTNGVGYGQEGGFGVQWEKPFQRGQHGRFEFFIVIKNYYSPATPNGDAALLDWMVIRPMQAGDAKDPSSIYHDIEGNGSASISPRGLTLKGTIIGGAS